MSTNNTSSVYITRIDTEFPVAGKANSSQGFRDNFSNIAQALTSINSDLSNLNKTSVQNSIDNDFNNNIISRAAFQNCSQISADNTAAARSGDIEINYTEGSVQYFLLSPGETNFTFINWPKLGRAGNLLLVCRPTEISESAPIIINLPFNSRCIGADTKFPETLSATTAYQIWTNDEGNNLYVSKLGASNAVVEAANELSAYDGMRLDGFRFSTSTETLITGDTLTHNAVIASKSGFYGKLALIPNRIRTLVTGTTTESANPYSSIYVSSMTSGIVAGASLRISTTSTLYSVGSSPSGTEIRIFPKLTSTTLINIGDIITFENPVFAEQPVFAKVSQGSVSNPKPNDLNRIGSYSVRQGDIFASTSSFYYAFADGDGETPNYFQVSADNVARGLAPGTTATTAITTDSSTLVATTEFVYNHVVYQFDQRSMSAATTVTERSSLLASVNFVDDYNNLLMKGVITMWSGDPTELPPYWKICDGNGGKAVNGVTIPDLKDKFIVGASLYGGTSGEPPYKVGVTGGANSVTLTVDQMPAHSHTYNDPGHQHNYRGVEAPSGSKDGGRESVAKTRATENAVTGITINSTGGGAAHENRPPFYALAFLIYVGSY